METGDKVIMIGCVLALAMTAIVALIVAAYYRGKSKLEELQRTPVKGAKRPCRRCGQDIPADWTVALKEDADGRLRVYHLSCVPRQGHKA